jgi:hypothetical protein
MKNFNTNALEAKIQGLSIQAGELFADLYRDQRHDSAAVDNALEAYKSLRRLLPREGGMDSRHIGATAAHAATQGDLIPRRV